MAKICRDCGTVGETKTVTRGSMLIELVLWLCFLIPGLIYSIWRLTTRYEACPKCGSKLMIPMNTPVGAQLAAQQGYVEPRRDTSAAESFGRRLGKLFAGR